MGFIYSASERKYVGHSTDERPMTDIPEDAILHEHDTAVDYHFRDGKWLTREQLFKEGRWVAISGSNGTSGILDGGIFNTGSGGTIWDAIYGVHQRKQTGTSVDNFAGFRSHAYAERSLNPYLRVVFSLDQITNISMFIGFSGYTATAGRNLGASSDADKYPTNSCFGVSLENNGANFKLYHNDGSSPGTNEATVVGVANINTIHTIEIQADNAIPAFRYRWDHAPIWTEITADIPIELNEMAIQFWIQNNVGGADRYLRQIDVETRIDNKWG